MQCDGAVSVGAATIFVTRLHYAMFIGAVSAYGGIAYWLKSQNPDINSPTLLTDAIASFLKAEAYRNAYLPLTSPKANQTLSRRKGSGKSHFQKPIAKR